MTYHFLAMSALHAVPPVNELVTKPQNRSMSAKKTVAKTVVTMTTTVQFVTSLRLGQVTLRDLGRDLFGVAGERGFAPVVDGDAGADERRRAA